MSIKLLYFERFHSSSICCEVGVPLPEKKTATVQQKLDLIRKNCYTLKTWRLYMLTKEKEGSLVGVALILRPVILLSLLTQSRTRTNWQDIRHEIQWK
jgi:hypothetical protein